MSRRSWASAMTLIVSACAGATGSSGPETGSAAPARTATDPAIRASVRAEVPTGTLTASSSEAAEKGGASQGCRILPRCTTVTGDIPSGVALDLGASLTPAGRVDIGKLQARLQSTSKIDVFAERADLLVAPSASGRGPASLPKRIAIERYRGPADGELPRELVGKGFTPKLGGLMGSCLTCYREDGHGITLPLNVDLPAKLAEWARAVAEGGATYQPMQLIGMGVEAAMTRHGFPNLKPLQPIGARSIKYDTREMIPQPDNSLGDGIPAMGARVGASVDIADQKVFIFVEYELEITRYETDPQVVARFTRIRRDIRDFVRALIDLWSTSL